MVESGTYYHSTGDTPSVSPYGLPAPPSGSQGSFACPVKIVGNDGVHAVQIKGGIPFN